MARASERVTGNSRLFSSGGCAARHLRCPPQSVCVSSENPVKHLEEEESTSQCTLGDFPGGPVGKTLPSSTRGVGLIPGRGAKIPHATRGQKPKTQNGSNIVTDSIKTGNDPH